MHTIFTITILLYYLSIIAELYWLAVPSQISTYRILKNKKPNRFYLVAISAIGFGAFILPFLCIAFSLFNITLINLSSHNLLLLISIIIIIIGRIFTFWGTMNIRNHLKKQNKDVLKIGIFSVSRHPIATGLIISLIGFNLAYLNVILVLLSVIFIVNMHYKILKEEELLLQQHPIGYLKYVQQSRRYL